MPIKVPQFLEGLLFFKKYIAVFTNYIVEYTINKNIEILSKCKKQT